MYTSHSIFQYGFGGKHKGWEIAIDVVDLLKNKYPDVFYLGAFSLSPFASATDVAYYNELLDKVRARGLEKHVAIQKGFQSEEMLIHLARCSRVALYPYQRPNASWASWGASGAVQLPISLGMPVVLSDFPCFQEFEGHLPVCKTPAEMAQVIDKIFSDSKYEASLRQESVQLSLDRSWDNTVKKYLSCGGL
jgi:glycosyltransferase involved in cell wall biosynthesis